MLPMKDHSKVARLSVLGLMLLNMLAILNLSVRAIEHGSLLGMIALYIAAVCEGSVVVLTTRGISSWGVVAYAGLVGVILLSSCYLTDQGRRKMLLTVGPVLILLSATTIAVGPGWGERFRH
jgi:hypothetical protein